MKYHPLNLQINLIAIKNVKVIILLLACVKYDKLIVCTTLKNLDQKYECIDEKCEEVCGVKFCRMEETENSTVRI